MPVHLHLQNTRKNVLFIDQESGPLRAPVRAPLVLLHHVHAVGAHVLLLWIDDQSERKVELGSEAPLGFGAVRAHADHHRVLVPRAALVVLEVARLTRPLEGIVLGVEGQKRLFASD